MAVHEKAPAEDLVYGFNWLGRRPWLQAGERIIESTWTVHRADGVELGVGDLTIENGGVLEEGTVTAFRARQGIPGEVYFVENTVRTDATPPNQGVRVKKIVLVERRME